MQIQDWDDRYKQVSELQRHANTAARTARYAMGAAIVSGVFTLILLALALSPSISCAGPGSGSNAPQALESMNDAELARFTDRCASAAGIAVGIALDRGGIDSDAQATLAALLERVATGEIKPVPGGPLSSLLDDAGLTDNEVRGAFLLAEGLLLDAGVDFAGALSERTRAVLMAVAGAVANARASQ